MFYLKLAIVLTLIAFFLFMGSVKCAPDSTKSQAAYNMACVRALVKDSLDSFATDAGCIEAERIVEFITSSSYIDNEGNLWQYQWTLVDPALPKRDAGDTGGSARGDTT